MVMLGDILAAACRAGGEFEDWLQGSDPELADEAALAAGAFGLSLGGYARMVDADFSRLASEEDWAKLVSSLKDSTDPGRTCLAAMVLWRFQAAACTVHSHREKERADE